MKIRLPIAGNCDLMKIVKMIGRHLCIKKRQSVVSFARSVRQFAVKGADASNCKSYFFQCDLPFWTIPSWG